MVINPLLQLTFNNKPTYEPVSLFHIVLIDLYQLFHIVLIDLYQLFHIVLILC